MSVSNTSGWPASHLRAAEIAFAALASEPALMTLDCDHLGAGLGLPPGQVPLPALRDWLLANPRNYAARDAVWRELILRARLTGGGWRIAAVGMAMPALRRFAAHLCAGYQGDPADIDAEILTGFLEALTDRVDLSKPAPYAALCYAAFRAGRRLRLAQDAHIPVADLETLAAWPRTPKRPYGHPDLLVERAHTLGLIDGDDVQPYIDIRLGRRAIEPIAAALGVSVDCLRMRLARADTKLAEALASGLLTGLVCVEAVNQLATTAARGRAVRSGRAATRRAKPTPVTIVAAA